MPTNITYKNNTLTTVTPGQSKILKTSGKYLEDDLIVSNSSSNQIKGVTITPTTSSQTQTVTPDSAYEGLSAVTVTVNPIPSSYIIPSGTINIANNTTGIDVTSYANAVVNVSPSLTTASVTPSETAQNITPGAGYDGLSSVTVNGITSTYVGTGVPRPGSSGISTGITEGYYKISLSTGYYSLVRKSLGLENKTVIPSETEQVKRPSSDDYYLESVTVAAITPTYVGSGVTTNPSITVSGPTVTVPSGYYDSQQTKTIANAVTTKITVGAFTPTISVDNNGLISTNSTTRGGAYMPIQTSGYISSSEKIRYNMPIGASTYQLPTLPAQSFTPSSTTQTVASTGKYMLGDITVQPIPSEYIIPTGVTTITSNGTHNVSSFASASVNVQPTLQAKTFTPSETSTTITSDAGKDGLSSVTVAGITNTYVGSSIPRRTNQDLSFSGGSFTGPSGYYSSDLSKNIPVGTLVSPTISSSGLVTAKASLDSAGAWLPSTESPKTLQLPTQGATTVIPSETAQTLSVNQKYMTGNVTVAAITPTYVGSGITRNPTVTVSGPSVTIPAGYYSSQQTKTVASGSVDLGIEATVEALPTITVNASGLITAINNTTGQVEIVVDPGYVSGNTTGTIGIAGESTRQLSTQGATTVTPSSTTQTINVTGKYMTGNVTVNPIPSQYIVPSGTYTISSVDSTNTFNVTNYASAKVTITDADSIAY